MLALILLTARHSWSAIPVDRTSFKSFPASTHARSDKNKPSRYDSIFQRESSRISCGTPASHSSMFIAACSQSPINNHQLYLHPLAGLILRLDQLEELVVPLPDQRLLADRQPHPGTLAG